jgi:hypothetical protein
MPENLSAETDMQVLKNRSQISSVPALYKRVAQFAAENVRKMRKMSEWKDLADSNPSALAYIMEFV